MLSLLSRCPRFEKSLNCHFYKQTTSLCQQLCNLLCRQCSLASAKLTWNLRPGTGTWTLEPGTEDLGAVILDLELGAWVLVPGTWHL